VNEGRRLSVPIPGESDRFVLIQYREFPVRVISFGINVKFSPDTHLGLGLLAAPFTPTLRGSEAA